MLSVALIPVLTSSTILDLVRGISHDEAKKVAIRLGVPRNYIDSPFRSKDPELHAHQLIEQWQKDFVGTEQEAIICLSTAFILSRLGSYAARLLVMNYPHAGYPSTHLPTSQPPLEMSLVQVPESEESPQMLPSFSPKQLLQTSSCSATVLLSLSHMLPNSSSVQLPQALIPSSQVQLPQMLPCSAQVQSPRVHVQLLGILRLVRAAILSLHVKDRKGSPQKDIIAYILTNCGACKDIQIKRALIKGIARGVVTCHLRPDGCIGFKLANLECCHTYLQRGHHHVYSHRSHPKCHHVNLQFKHHYKSLRRSHFKGRYTRSHFKRYHTSLRESHLKHHLRGSHFNHHSRLCRSQFKCYHNSLRLKRQLCRNRFRHHTAKPSDETKMGMITIFPSSVHSGGTTDTPTQIPSPINIETTVPEHLKVEAPQKAADTTTPLIPFPTPSKEDDVAPPKDTIHRILPKPETSHEAKVQEDILKIFFITILGTQDSSTVASVGRALVGDCNYERIVNHGQEEYAKRVITQIFEEWKQECKGDLDFRKLRDVFREIGCKDLVERTELYIRKQIRLFSFDEFM